MSDFAFIGINSRMPEVSDMELLRDYDRQGAEDAFAALVQRHINLVYSVASYWFLKEAGPDNLFRLETNPDLPCPIET